MERLPSRMHPEQLHGVGTVFDHEDCGHESPLHAGKKYANGGRANRRCASACARKPSDKWLHAQMLLRPPTARTRAMSEWVWTGLGRWFCTARCRAFSSLSPCCAVRPMPAGRHRREDAGAHEFR
jgi:hypothetical protein